MQFKITIEPLAFLAIVALYIELPSIQDIIYTKICLQVVSNQAKTTTIPNNSNNKSINYFSENNTTQLNANFLASNQFPSGKIQQNSTNNVINQLKIPPPAQVIDDHEQFICDRLNKSSVPEDVRLEIASGDALFWLEYELVICTLCALSAPYWGGMSDIIGRLVPMNVPIIMAAFSNLLSLIFGLLISLKSHDLFRIEWLYVGGILTGISGGQAVILLNCFSFISDNSSSENRTKRVVVLESVIFAARSIGFYITKHIMKLGLNNSLERPWLNRHFVAFSTCILINCLALLYTICNLRHRKVHKFANNFERERQEAFAGGTDLQASALSRGSTLGYSRNINSETSIVNCVPDRARELTSSVPNELDGPSSQPEKAWSTILLTFNYYKQTYETLTKARESRLIIILLLFCGFISAMSLVSLMSLLYLYLHNDPFDWPTSQYSQWNSISSLTRGVALVALTLTKLFKVFNFSDPIVSAVGFLSKAIGLTMISLAQAPDLINWSIVAFILSEYSLPPIRSLLSKLVIKEEVGKVYSCLAAIQSLCILLGNIAFYVAFKFVVFQAFFRASFLVVAGFQFLAVLIMLFVYISLRHRTMIM